MDESNQLNYEYRIKLPEKAMGVSPAGESRVVSAHFFIIGITYC